ncbi:hypothetical protein [Serratia marcescens]
MEIDIFSDCAYTSVGIRQLIKQTWAEKRAPAGFSPDSYTQVAP